MKYGKNNPMKKQVQVEDRGKNMKAINIKWDTDGDIELLQALPTQMEIPEDMTDEEEISEYLSDEIGFCHYGFELVD